VFLVHMIRYGQLFGFSLAELREIVAAKVRERVFPLARAKALCERKRQSIREEIAALMERDRALVLVQADMTRIFGDRT
jgi:DNA-binding transcriptional MerR regulator